MKRFLTVSFLLLLIKVAGAQGFTQSIGIRAAWITPGIEYRYYTSDALSIRGLLAVRDGGLQVHALSEFHQYDLFPFSYQLVFFYGLGVHFGYESWNEWTDEINQRNREIKSAVLAGVDGIIGLEYLFYEAPLKAGIEMKPFFDVFGRRGFKFVVPDFALTVKYLF
jgi:hypothetical protein